MGLAEGLNGDILCQKKHIWTEGLASPLVFRSSRVNHDDESNQTSELDKNNHLQEKAHDVARFRIDPEKAQRDDKRKSGYGLVAR